MWKKTTHTLFSHWSCKKQVVGQILAHGLSFVDPCNSSAFIVWWASLKCFKWIHPVDPPSADEADISIISLLQEGAGLEMQRLA